MSSRYDIAVIGGGIVGLATARALLQAQPALRLVLLEAENRLAAHQSGNNSGVIHSGLYYKPGSLKARNCAAGRDAIYAFCAEHDIAHERCGKVVVATSPAELPWLDELQRRGTANGLEGIRRLDRGELQEREPHVAGVGGLWVPQTGIVDYPQVAETFAAQLRQAGAEIRTGARVGGIDARADGFVLRTPLGEIDAGYLINCAGLQCDRVARMCGLDPGVRIVPFRGEYYRLKPEACSLVRNLIYPVPDPRFPFLGVHFTRMIRGGVEAGPNAVLALKREGYSWGAVSPRDLAETAGYPGFWRMASRYWRTGIGEVYRSLSRGAFVRALQKLIPELRADQVERHGAGVRAQAVAPDGSLLDDFHLLQARRQLHVLNAPSPAATASISIGGTLAERTGLIRHQAPAAT